MCENHPLFGLLFPQKEGILALWGIEKNRPKGGNDSMQTPTPETTLWSNLLLEIGLTIGRGRCAG